MAIVYVIICNDQVQKYHNGASTCDSGLKDVSLTNVSGQNINKKGHQLKAKEVGRALSLNLVGPVDMIPEVGSIKCANVFGVDFFMCFYT